MATANPQRVDARSVASMWMCAVANAVGHTPEVAKPLALLYVAARAFPAIKPEPGNLEFAGMPFVEVDEGRFAGLLGLRRIVTAKNYDRQVVSAFPTPQQHHELFYLAADVAQSFPIGKLDATPVAWDVFLGAFHHGVPFHGTAERWHRPDEIQAGLRKIEATR